MEQEKTTQETTHQQSEQPPQGTQPPENPTQDAMQDTPEDTPLSNNVVLTITLAVITLVLVLMYIWGEAKDRQRDALMEQREVQVEAEEQPAPDVPATQPAFTDDTLDQIENDLHINIDALDESLNALDEDIDSVYQEE